MSTIVALVAAIGAGGAWYAWQQGSLGHNPDAPSPANFMAALQAFHAQERVPSSLNADGAAKCLKLPPLPPNSTALTGLAQGNTPNLYVYPFVADAGAQQAQQEIKKRLDALALAGLLEKSDGPHGLQYRMTWAGGKHIVLGTTLFCAPFGSFGPINILHIERLTDSKSKAVRYAVKYRYALKTPADWLEKPGVRELIGDILKNSPAVTGEDVTRNIYMSWKGWAVEGGPPPVDEVNTPPVLPPDRYFKAGGDEFADRLAACLPLPDLASPLIKARLLPTALEEESKNTYLALDVMFDKDGHSGLPEERGRMRQLRQLVKNGVLTGEEIEEKQWPRLEGTTPRVLGGKVYRIASQIKPYLIVREDHSQSDRGHSRYCLRFADADVTLFQSRLEGYTASDKKNPFYTYSGKITPKSLYDWFKPLMESPETPEAKIFADGLFFHGRGTYDESAQMWKGVVSVIYPSPRYTQSTNEPLQRIVRQVETIIRAGQTLMANASTAAFLANDPRAVNNVVNILREQPEQIGAMRRQCSERIKAMSDSRSLLAELHADEDYRTQAAALGKILDKSRTDLENHCRLTVARIRDVLATFPQLRTKTVEAQLGANPPAAPNGASPWAGNYPTPAPAPAPARAPEPAAGAPRIIDTPPRPSVPAVRLH